MIVKRTTQGNSDEMNEQITGEEADWKPPININCKDIFILVVDNDHTSLSVIGGILRSWKYNVETVRNGEEALSILRSKQDKKIDLVVTDIHMPDMNGFELLKRISIDFQVPIVMMSSDDSEKVMTKGLKCGASYFMRKPVCPKDLQNLWLYVIPKKNQDSSSTKIDIAETNSTPKSPGNSTNQKVAETSAHSAQFMTQGPWPIAQYMEQRKTSLVEKNQDDKRRRKKISNLNQKPKVTATASVVPLNYPASVFANRKPKVAWFTGLHNKFLDALKIIGLDRAVPKKILEVMNVPGLTRENVASHLQKYRIFLKKIADVAERGTDGMSKSSKSKFASSYLQMPLGFNFENLDEADENLLRKKLKLELRAIRDPIYMGRSWRQYETMLPTNNLGNKQMSVAGLVELGGTSCATNFMVGSDGGQDQATPGRNKYEMTSADITNVNSRMIIGRHSSAFVSYGVNVNNYVPQVTNNLGNGFGMESQNSCMMMMSQQGMFCNAVMQNATGQPLEEQNVNNEVGNGFVNEMSNNSLVKNKNRELELIRKQMQQDSSYFGEDFNPWFDQETTQTQAGNQKANMLITDELLAMCQGFRGDAGNSSKTGSLKKSDAC